jgi:hypothetical protein
VEVLHVHVRRELSTAAARELHDKRVAAAVNATQRNLLASPSELLASPSELLASPSEFLA